MRRMLSILFVLVVSACGKGIPEPAVSVLEEKTFSEESGRFMVLVGGNGVWSVSSSANWIQVEERYYKDEAAFEVRYDSNESSIGDHRFCRVGKVYVESWDGRRRDEVIIRQEGLVPVISLAPLTIGEEAGQYSMSMENNLSDKERAGLSFTSDAGWISDLSYGRDGESIDFTAAAGSGRSARICVTFTDAWGRKFTAEAIVTQ